MPDDRGNQSACYTRADGHNRHVPHGAGPTKSDRGTFRDNACAAPQVNKNLSLVAFAAIARKSRGGTIVTPAPVLSSMADDAAIPDVGGETSLTSVPNLRVCAGGTHDRELWTCLIHVAGPVETNLTNENATNKASKSTDCDSLRSHSWPHMKTSFRRTGGSGNPRFARRLSR